MRIIAKKKLLIVRHRSRSRSVERVAHKKKERVQILDELELTKREAMMVLHWISIDRFKVHGCFRRGNKVKAFLSKEIRVMVLQRRGDDLVAMKARHGLGVDNYGRSVVICHVVAK